MIKTILWDFDGVILDSMKIRDLGFVVIFKNYPKNLVDKLLDYHNENGGLSRYIKIKYFYNELLGKEITQERIQEYADAFSKVMLEKLGDKNLLINNSVDFILKNYKNYNFHIVSGSDGKELNILCKRLDIAQYFLTIQGSPTHKNKLVQDLMSQNSYDTKETCLIGDSINDYNAADNSDIYFLAFNNDSLNTYSNLPVSDKELINVEYK